MTSGDAVRKVVTDAVNAGMNAGLAATQSARARAEELLERGRSSTEQMAGLIRKEIADQLASMGLATTADLADLEARLRAKPEPRSAAAKTPAAKPSSAKTPAAKPSSAKTPAAKPSSAKTPAAKPSSAKTPAAKPSSAKTPRPAPPAGSHT